jgi:hypothetical protein
MEKGPEGEINQAKRTLRQNAQLFLKPFSTLKYPNLQSINTITVLQLVAAISPLIFLHIVPFSNNNFWDQSPALTFPYEVSCRIEIPSLNHTPLFYELHERRVYVEWISIS